MHLDNLQSAQQLIQTIQERNAGLLERLQNTKVTSIEEQKIAEEDLAIASKEYKKLKETQESILKPHRQTEQALRSLFKPILDKYETFIKAKREALSVWIKTQENITKEEIDKKVQDFWDKSKEAKETGELVPLPDLSVSPIPKTSYHNMGSTTYRKKINVIILEPHLIPREYCVPSEELLRTAGELAMKQDMPMPTIEGAIIEVVKIPVTNPIRG